MELRQENAHSLLAKLVKAKKQWMVTLVAPTADVEQSQDV